MLSHLSFGVRDLAAATRFYRAILAPLGFVQVWSNARGVGFGAPGGPDRLALFSSPTSCAPGAGFHLALEAPSQDAVTAFHAAAIAQGGASQGAPGLRLAYGPNYFAAFVTDLDGYKLEAVHQLEPSTPL